MAALNVGDTFSSFEDFAYQLELFQRETNTQFTIRSAERLKDNDILRYSIIKYVCKQGAKVHQPQSTMERPIQRSFKVGCPVMMNVRLNRPKGKDPFLKVTKLEMRHENHQVSKEIFRLYPEQRRFVPDDTDTTVLNSVTMKTAEQREILERRHHTAVLAQDIYNKRKKIGVEQIMASDEQRCEYVLKDIVLNGGYGEVGKDERGEFVFVVFQSKDMRNLLFQYPECLILDCTYKVNNYLYPLLTIMVVDHEGHGMPVFHAFLAKEDSHIMEKCLRIFALQYNSEHTSCFIVDKDMAEIAAIGAVFPGVPVNLCHFHISQAVERYLRKALGRSASVVKLLTSSFMKQVCTESEEEFGVLKREISQIVPQSVIQYFEDNWWSKRHLWAACCNVNVIKFHVNTTNALESYHSKIKKTINEKLSLSKTLMAIISFNDSKILDCRKLLTASNCNVYDHTDSDDNMIKITKTMTKFSAQLVKRELLLSQQTPYSVSPSLTEGTHKITYKDRDHFAGLNSCSCSTFGHMQIPCRHIFFLRNHLCVDVFDESLVPNRFKLCFNDHSESLNVSNTVTVNTISNASHASFKSIEGRFRTAKSLCDKVTNYLAILGELEFTEKINELEALLLKWSDGSSSESSASCSGCPEPSLACSGFPEHPPSSMFREPPSCSGSPEPPSCSGSPAHPPSSRFREPPSCSGSPEPPSCSGSPEPPSCSGSPEPPSCSGSPEPPSCSGSPEPQPSISSLKVHQTVEMSQVAHTDDVVIAEKSSKTLSDIKTMHRMISVLDSQSGLVQGVIDVHAFEDNSDKALPCPSSADGLREKSRDQDLGATDLDVQWPKMSKLRKPRGRPGTKQRFTLTKMNPSKRFRSLPTKFTDLNLEKQQNMLIRAVSTYNCLPPRNTLITCGDLKLFEMFADVIMDDKVNLDCIKDFFEPEAWVKVVDGVVSRRETQLFYCGQCKDLDDLELKMVQCEGCLIWYHFHCVGYSSKKQVETWFCDLCM